MDTLLIILDGLMGLAVGIFIGRYLLNKLNTKKQMELEAKLQQMTENARQEAETIKKEKLIEAKEAVLKMKSEVENELNRRKNQLIQNDGKLKQREQNLNKKLEKLNRSEAELESQQLKLNAQLEIIKVKREEAEKIHEEELKRLEKISGLDKETAKEQMLDIIKRETKTKASAQVRNIVEETKMSATKEAKRIVLNTIQRTATEHAIENCVSIFNIENEEVKGKIIGREGRNIRALEASTGIELIIDDTPDAIIISGFDPVRREIARLSLHRLVSDGRIHPARIEEVVSKTQADIDEEIKEIGERTTIDLGIHGLHPELVKLVGRMRFRSSYGQNLLQHSREVANLSATMASEMGLNAKHAKRAGLLHDIGKVYSESPERPHALIGFDLTKKYNEHPNICNAVGAHHDEMEMTSLISPVIQACDAISGSRPGARREVMESYIQRIKDLEKMALQFDGVNQCYAIQAGRELRVMVDSENITDNQAKDLSFAISQKIEGEMQYPGQIKVTVIREMRSIAFAK